jgi:glutamate formiminotransferase/formiminotetrahydrofolate cyclodeaminase
VDKFIHAVPNFSEGRRPEVIQAIVQTFEGIDGVKLIDHYPDYNFNRTVIEVIGKPEPLKEALLAMAGKSYELINMEEQTGAHPRIGAQDTIPLFPLANVTLQECVDLAEEIGQEVFKRYHVPVYFSGENARNEDRKNLAFIRKGQYEGLKEVAHLPERAPDIGPAALHPTAGATIVSAANSGLVAVNVILDSEDLEIAKTIAKMVRGPSGGFSTIRSVGFYMEDKKKVAVSMNMFDTDATPLYRVLRVIEAEAERYGTKVVGTQLVGTFHQDVLVNCAAFYLKLVDFDYKQIIENHMIGL